MSEGNYSCKFCRSCGAMVGAADAYCAKCGALLRAAPPPRQAPPQTPAKPVQKKKRLGIIRYFLKGKQDFQHYGGLHIGLYGKGNVLTDTDAGYLFSDYGYV